MLFRSVDSPLLETTVNGASDIIVNFSGNVGIVEAYDAITYLTEVAGEDANIIFGTVDNDVVGEDVSITIIATGLEEGKVSAVSTPRSNVKVPVSQGIKNPASSSFVEAPVKAPSFGTQKTKAQPVPLNLGQSQQPAKEASPAPAADTSDVKATSSSQSIKIPDFLKRG